ncbi:MAG: histidine kinase [Pelodictyon luteolum]|jgi:CheY-like chemotaxis protein|uniref:Histidine kinase n=1 Tax=Pelodictyon luteolum TaxID=1100 RepID=A0A165M1D3_PELLU|nr:response regulator [Pelodictyon luteolum]KZK74693.1 MAG: histidine kinase [Pelodictyon luteolum]
MNILVIDDDAAVRKFICTTLLREHHTVLEADNGKTGLQMLAQHPEVELMVTDLIMPEKEGIETIMEARQSHPDLKIVAMSGGGKVGPENYLVLADALGANVTLKKPFSAQELLLSLKFMA